MKKVRDEMGLKNLILTLSCRRVEEAKKVIAEMEKNGLKRGENDLQVYDVRDSEQRRSPCGRVQQVL